MLGVLLFNVGTPDSPEPEDVGRYLSEFLMDPKVINFPWLLRFLFVRALVVPRRKYASSQNYKKIWTDEGSPLLVHTKKLGEELAKTFSRKDIELKVAMRYGSPSLREALVEWVANPPRKIVVVPMYPQYAESSTQTGIDKIVELVRDLKIPSAVTFTPPFYSHAGFLDAVAGIAKDSLQNFRADHILFSYHGLPKTQVERPNRAFGYCGKSANCCDTLREENMNCYRAQCFATSRSLARRLSVQNWSVSFQSRLGPSKWIEPYTDQVLETLARGGVKRLAVLCPSFTTDCLETLEELGLRGRESFLNAGGEDYCLVPSPNAHPLWIAGLRQIIQDSL